VASTLNGFQLEADKAGKVADVLAKAFASSALDIEKFEVAISKVAPIAAGLGIDIETTTAALGKLVSAGFDASTAGTQFRNILLKLSDPSSELANTLGFTVSSSDDLVESFKTLNKEQLTIAEAQGLIDVRSVALLKSLSDNSKGVEGLRKELENAAGTAEDISSKQLKTLNGSIRLLSSAYEGFILSIEDGTGSIAEFLRGILQVTTGVFNLLVGTKEAQDSFNKLDASVQDLASRIVGFFNVLKGVVKTLFDFREIIVVSVAALKAYSLAMSISNRRLISFTFAQKRAIVATKGFSKATCFI
jgi:TP901 family phage tail tape measure protein